MLVKESGSFEERGALLSTEVLFLGPGCSSSLCVDGHHRRKTRLSSSSRMKSWNSFSIKVCPEPCTNEMVELLMPAVDGCQRGTA